jgi:hypothetical protein
MSTLCAFFVATLGLSLDSLAMLNIWSLLGIVVDFSNKVVSCQSTKEL